MQAPAVPENDATPQLPEHLARPFTPQAGAARGDAAPVKPMTVNAPSCHPEGFWYAVNKETGPGVGTCEAVCSVCGRGAEAHGQITQTPSSPTDYRFDAAERRIAFLEIGMRQVKTHAAQVQGHVAVLAYLAFSAVMDRARATENPYGWIEHYIAATAESCKRIATNVEDPEERALVRLGIDTALREFFENLMVRAADLPGAPKQPVRN